MFEEARSTHLHSISAIVGRSKGTEAENVSLLATILQLIGRVKLLLLHYLFPYSHLIFVRDLMQVAAVTHFQESLFAL